jgi:alkylated DNA nucleotide flippase Atl1
MTVRAHVLGPHNVPVIRDAQAAAADLPMAVFSAVTHGKSPDAAAILEALFAALDTTEPATAALFAEFTGLGLGSTRAGQIWRNLMSTYTSWFRSPWIETVREEGRIEGRAEARTEDHSDARAEGAAKARSQDVLKVLRKRGISVPSYMAQAIEGCRDLDVLERWFDRSLSITAAGQLFAED